MRYENDSALLECEGCGEAAPATAALAGNGGKSGGGFVVGLLKSAEAVAGKDKLKVGRGVGCVVRALRECVCSCASWKWAKTSRCR
jgi:hypothetical protein